ncbi:cytochrome c-type biogenesis protein [Pasteurella atlantica]|uniref:cytochrome c-type biogenesis protein n=1 Tax=Pasteurellaceae TaxID=712 RepID=UPI00275D3F39|nr:cytochrome c-type biogenesis protein [Pasteurella atlantica]MDP8099497.1 cytochrome c-type biogenesis protein CcmH [Pasteurella atlantica]MDP8107385.1 cytochrome c-type biogenesis protein CcmH [Pasteurella atlantica]MDP8117077.1 cytochrome c-type biogenesis protein CcmH [Pasteurella atlantica]
MKKIVYLLLFCFSLSAVAAIDALDFSSPQQEEDYHLLTQELRCPQCQNNNIADSNATIAVDMRAKVFELLQEGKQKQDIIDYMVERYGHFVTYDPPVTTATAILWIAPVLLILFGLFFIFSHHSRKNKTQKIVKSNEDLTASEQQRLATLLKEKE